MKILMVNKFLYPRGGSESYMLYLAHHLTKMGHEVQFFGMFDEKNTVGNFENVGFAKPGSECLYNIYMMEELHSIFGAGAGAVTKLVELGTGEDGSRRIKRIFAPKYPYEYIRDIEKILKGDEENPSYKEKVFEFFGK